MKAQRAALRDWRGLPPIRQILPLIVPVGLLGLWLIGVLVRILIRDRLPELAYVYYATPPPVLAALAAAAGAWWLIGRRWKLAMLPLVLAAGSAVWAYGVMWYHHTPTPNAAGGIRVLFWNAAHGNFGWARVASEIRRHDADVVALVEGTNEHTDMAAVWRQYLPEYRALVFDEGITLLSRVEVKADDHGMLGGDELMAFGWYAHCEVATPTGPLHLVIADFEATERRSRYLPVDHLCQQLEPLKDLPVLIAGDLNTPTDSVFLQSLRQSYRHAFESVGNGYAATWPVPVPVLTLDQVWFNDGVQVERCALGWSWISDHRPVVLEVSLRQ